MEWLEKAFEWALRLCYDLCGNFGWAVIIFTLLTKIILLPLSVWVHKNSIKMVKLQPDVNFLKVNHYGDPDAIAEGQSALYKKEGYHPLLSIIPTVVQLVLLMGVIAGIKRGMADPTVDMLFCGVDLGLVPSECGGWLILSPILAGASAWLMCAAQNRSNVLQSEQSKWNKYSMLILSVGLSLYLGYFVSVGVALYWIFSNLFSIAQMYILNAVIKPGDYVDYARLEESRRQLESIEALGSGGKKQTRAEARRERLDYNRFFSVVNKHLVFYSESSGFYKYYKGIIEYILKNTNLTVHYITSDPNDQVFRIAETQPNLKPYYIAEKKLIVLMMKLDCDVMVMTMPDIENFHIKRSYVRDNIEYIYLPHGMGSYNLTLRKGCVDHYDTVLCCGSYHNEELRALEELNGTKRKELVNWGYCLLDEMIADYESKDWPEHEKKEILIAPSWQKDNIVDSCISEILDNLSGKGYHIIVRPHPQHVRHRAAYMESLKERYSADPDIEIQTDFSSNSTVFSADMLITDWSDIAWEYAFTTKRPVLFVNTPMKIMNPEYDKLPIVPMNIALRKVLGCDIDPDRLGDIDAAVRELLENKDGYRDIISKTLDEMVYNVGSSAEVGAKYIIAAVQKKVRERKENNEKNS